MVKVNLLAGPFVHTPDHKAWLKRITPLIYKDEVEAERGYILSSLDFLLSDWEERNGEGEGLHLHTLGGDA